MWVFVAIMCAINGGISVLITLITISRHRQGLTDLLGKAGTGETSRTSTRIFFWLPLLLVTTMLFLTRAQPGEILWMLIRFIGVSLSLYGIAKVLRRLNIHQWLNRFGLWGPSVALRSATDRTNLPRE
jgi:hypothetical protein